MWNWLNNKKSECQELDATEHMAKCRLVALLYDAL